MKDKKKLLMNFIFFSLLFMGTYYIIFKDQDIYSLIDNLKHVNLVYIFIGFLLMLCFYLLEAINVKNILKSFGEKITLKQTFNSTLIGAFFSAITPASSGGQPMQVYYLSKKDGVKVSHSTLALLIHLLGHQFSIVSIGIICAILNPIIFETKLMYLFIIGTLFNLIVLLLYFVLIFSNRITNKLVSFVRKIIKFLKLKNYKEIDKKINDELKLFHESSKYIKDHKKEFFKAIFVAVLQVLANYSVAYFIYRSFGLNEFSILYVISLQAILFCTVSCIPLPGSVGISETVFLLIYAYIYPNMLLHNALLLHRGVSFYLFVLINLIVVLINSIKISKKDSQK
ncbi:MAG: flippase-like domain-containing protein [Bacilli bacterium]|nr:flippase-like domain-containing protein [Bacilli bacterium]